MGVDEVVVVVPIQHGEAVLVIFQQGNGRVVAVGGAAQLAEGTTLQRAQHDAQRRAVAEHRHGLAVVLLRDPRQRRNKTIQHLLRRFAAGHLPAV